MDLYLYPEGLRRLFTDREEETHILEAYRQRLLEGAPFPYVSLFGPRRIGKSLLLKEFLARTLERDDPVLPVYVNLEGHCLSVEAFATAYIGLTCYWRLARGQTSPWDYLHLSTLPGLVAGKSAAAEQTVRRLAQECQALRPDRQRILQLAFAFPQELGAEAGIKVIMILDEFQELASLQNLPEARNLLALFRSFTESQGDVAYFLAGSAVAIMHRLIADPASPLFVQFAQVPLAGFQPAHTAALLEKLLFPLAAESAGERRFPADQFAEVIDETHYLTHGHPYYITVLGERLRMLDALTQPLSRDAVRKAFVSETLSPTGRLYEFCRYVYDLSLQKARGYVALKAVLDLLAAEDGLGAGEIARQLRVSHAAASEYLRALVEVDVLLIVTEGGGRKPRQRYFYRDPVLRYWVAMVTRGIEAPPTAPPVDLPALLEKLDRLYQQTATQLGLAKESQVRELLRAFAGQMVDGSLLGVTGKISLPTFTEVAAFVAPDNSFELDALAKAQDGERWAVEVKWRNRQVDFADLSGFHQKALRLNARPWLVTKTGLTPSAQRYAQEKGILVSTERELQALAERLRVRFGK